MPIELSVVVVVVSDTVDRRANASLLAGSLAALESQIDPPSTEVIVPYHPLTRGIDEVKRRFAKIRFIEIGDIAGVSDEKPGREHHDILRARGLAAARGEIVALLEDHGRADPHFSRRVVEAHRSGRAAVGGAMDNEVDRALNWAVYFCDFGRYQNPVHAGEAATVSDANVSYDRSALSRVVSVWRDAFREPAVNAALTDSGVKLYLDPGVIVSQNRGELSLGTALRERFVWARSYAVERSRGATLSRRFVYAAMSPALPVILTSRMTLAAARKRTRLRQFVRALPFTLVLTAGWAAGEAVGYLTGSLPGERQLR
jgi:hypothetical protein